MAEQITYPITADDRYNSYIRKAAEMLQKEGDDFYESGTRGLFKRLRQQGGAYGAGEGLMNDLKIVRRQMADNETTDADLINKVNTIYGEYNLPEKYYMRVPKLIGGQEKLDVDGDGKISGQDFKLLRKQKQKGGLSDNDKTRAKQLIDRVATSPQKFESRIEERNYYKELRDEEFLKDKEAGVPFKELQKLYGDLNTYIKRKKKEEAIGDSIVDPRDERTNKDEGGSMSMDDQMQMAMGMTEEPQMMEENTSMLPDEVMENNYLDFIIDEALTEDEESMLMSKLEQDEQLSMLFDKVLEVASEFAGSGPVEGPGSGVSDSIPARLSDGEFVFTAKATEEIGADELMRMMKDAEAAADKRQGMQTGGQMDSGEEQILSDIAKPQVVNQGTNVLEEDEMSKTIKDNMVNPNVQNDYVRS